jgi:hypothetical protein
MIDPSTTTQTEGSWRVGVNFNPSSLDEVDDIKRATAEIIDDLNEIASNPDHPGARCAAEAMILYEAAAMWAVKAYTTQANV